MKSLKYIFFAFVISFIALSNINAETCTYNGSIDGADFTYRCSVSASAMSCSFVSNGNVSYKKYENNTVSNSTSSQTSKMKIADYLDENGNVDCSRVSSLTIDVGVTSLQEIHVFNVGENISCGIASGLSYQYSGCPTFKLTNNNSNGNSGAGDISENNGGASDTTFDTSTFCTGPVQGVFTTLGWVFFILKILIPIILIIFGSIDFAKAVLSSKDDEIKKSAKTLVMRAIAGVIIFFVPTLLNFIVELLGEDDLYNGTFATCTHCMLEPTDDACRKLVD